MRLNKLTLIWGLAVVLAAIHVLAFGQKSAVIGAVDMLNLFITAGLLPFVAGFVAARGRKIGRLAAAAAGASITLATTVGVGFAYLVIAAGWLAFGGFVIATVMFTVVPSIAFGVLGGWMARKYEPTHI